MGKSRPRTGRLESLSVNLSCPPPGARILIDSILVAGPPGTLYRPEPIYNDDLRPIPGSVSRECPRAEPKLPPAMLQELTSRCRELKIVATDESILWHGRRSTMNTVCSYPRCGCFPPSFRVEVFEGPTGRVVTVDSRVVDVTYTQWKVLRRLADSRPGGVSGLSEGDVKILQRLKLKPPWIAVLQFPGGNARGGYSLL